MLLSAIQKPLVQKLLEHGDGVEWSTQGLGMLRCYLAPEIRLHIWDSEQKAEDVSELHTHPWDFESVVVAGVVENDRYVETEFDPEFDPGETNFLKGEIFCGEGGGLTEKPPVEVRLSKYPTEIFREGDVYAQKALEIHRSRPLSGTVTIIRRHFEGDRDHAFVYWPLGEEWVTAEPRPATDDEVARVVEHSLKAWFE